MRKVLATLSAIVALSLPSSVEAILGAEDCINVVPVTVEVKRGDTLMGLASAYYDGDISRYQDIARANGITSTNQIRVGQVLVLPGKTYELRRPVSVNDMPAGGYCNASHIP